MIGISGMIKKLSNKNMISVPDDKEALDILKELLIGHSVKKISKDELKTDTNYILKFEGNEGCCCGAGCYYIDELNECNNIITNVELKETNIKYDEYKYEIFVFTENKKIKLMECNGDDGNGYYGSGYWITINLEGEIK